jgi:hypothetical protein
MSTPAFSPQILGQTEKALNILLDRQLHGTGLTEPQWVTLTLTVTAAGGGTIERDRLVAQLADGLKISESEAKARISELAAAQLLQAPADERLPVTPTDAGQQLHAKIRTAVVEITQRLWGDLPPEDLATAGRVLSTILARVNAELAGT